MAVRSLIYQLFFYPWTVLIGLTLPILLLLPVRYTLMMSRLWIRGLFLVMRHVCRLDFEVRGQENLPAEGTFIIASKHQSVWETFIFVLMFPHPAYVLKRELLYMPFFGQFVRRLDMIAINRSDGTGALKQLVSKTRRITETGRPVIIFPEGTRTRPGAPPRYKKGGITVLYQDLPDVPVIPAGLNSGLFWARNSWKKYPGTIIMEILPAIPKGLSSKEFIQRLENDIETASNRAIAEAERAA